MKKKSTSKSAFFNLRVLIGLFIVLAGVFLALAGVGTFSAITAGSAQAQQKQKIIPKSILQALPPGFDCSTIHEKGIDKMENLRAGAIMIACGEAEGGSASPYPAFSQLLHKLTTPLAYGAADVDLITGTETFPHVTQSETYTTANPDNPNQIVVTYNDSRTAPGNYSGGSFSSDGGTTFTRLTPNPFSTGHGTNFGDPVTLYNKPTSTFFGIFIATGCGGQGLGSWKSTDGGVTWSVGACVHNGGFDDRESGYADNTTSSPFFGRMYVSWNDFNAGQGIFVTYSSDNGTTWHSPIQITSTFFRNVQITGDKVTGDVYIAGMNEMGGNTNFNRANKIYRSTDGGNTWTNTYTGPTFNGPHRSNSGYFATMYGSPAYWRHMGWGEPAAFNHVVSLVYDGANAGNGDPADVFYIRSTDSGVTFGAPLQLNTDTDHTKAQWQPNLSVSDAGTLFATWYDETPRVAASCQPSSPSTPCYRMYARKSNDNGVTWLAPDTLSDVDSPLPLQPDGNVQGAYAGDYDYGSAILTKHVTSWVDGRVIISGQSQQDAFTDREPVGTPSPTPTGTPSPTPTPTASPTPTPTPTCTVGYTTATGSGTITAGGTDIGNHCDDCTTQINLPFPVSVYGNPPISVASVGSDGDIHFVTAPYNKLFWWMGCVPVDPGSGQDPFLNTLFPNYADLWTDANPLQTCTDCGIFTQTLGTAPNRQFVIRWKTTYFNFAGTAEFEVLLTEGSNTLSVIYGATADNGLTAVSGIQQDLNVFTSFSCDEAVLTPGLRVDYIPTGCGSPTPTPTATATATATPTATATAAATATATAAATATPTPTATVPPRATPTPRPRPTPPPRP